MSARRLTFYVGLIALPVGIRLIKPHYLRPHTTAEFAQTVVMVLNQSETAGGTGLILSSKPGESQILTNKHVCKLIENGGIIERDGLSYVVQSYKESPTHDLCLIKVDRNLHVNVKLAPKPPKIYSDATIVGHPALFPTIITKGHFSDHYLVRFSRTEQEIGQLVSATVMPGSSGSPVFDENGELAGVVFATRGDALGYGIIIPHEFVDEFLNHDAKKMGWTNVTPKPAKKARKTSTNPQVPRKDIGLRPRRSL